MTAEGQSQQALELLEDLVFRLLDDNARLMLRVMQGQRADGRKSERITEEQLNLLMKLMPAQPAVPSEPEPAAAADNDPAPQKKPPRPPRSGEPPPGLPKRHKTISVPAEERHPKPGP